MKSCIIVNYPFFFQVDKHMTLTLLGSNLWVSSHTVGMTSSGAVYSFTGGGSVTLSGALDRVRITTANGTDTFDAGTINLLLEG